MRTAVLLLLLSAAAFAQQPVAASTAEQQVVALEHRWLSHLDDPAALGEILAPDFVHVLPSGMISKDDHIAWAERHAAPAGLKRRFAKLDVRLYGDTAIANGAVVATAADGHSSTTYFTDVFVRRQGRWQAVNAQENAAAKAH